MGQSMNKRKHLYLITENYPFGDGEGSFIVPELPYLKELFDITIVSLSLSNDQTCELDDEIQLIHHNRNVNPFKKLVACLKYFFRTEGRNEIREIIKGKGPKLTAFRDSTLFFGEAERFRQFLNKILDNRDKDIILYNYWYFWGAYACIMLREKKPNLIVVTRTHRFELYDEGYPGNRQPFKRYMNRHIDRIFFIAEHGRKYLLDRYADQKDILEDKCILSRLGISKQYDEVSVPDHKKDIFTLVSCSLLIPRKRVDLIVKGLSLIEDTSIRWIHFGDGSENSKIRALAASLLEPKQNIEFVFKGNVDSEEILKYYAENRVDAFITTSASEGCPVSIQEAMAYGIPIIGTSINEIPYMINGNGVLLGSDPTDEEIKEAIEQIVKADDVKTAKMRQRSEEIYREEFDANKNFSRFADLLNKV